MLKENLITDYQIFFDLRDKYPEHRKLISEIMRYSFENKDSFCSSTYLNGKFKESDIKFIFDKLNLPLTISRTYPTTLRGSLYTIIEISLN